MAIIHPWRHLGVSEELSIVGLPFWSVILSKMLVLFEMKITKFSWSQAAIQKVYYFSTHSFHEVGQLLRNGGWASGGLSGCSEVGNEQGLFSLVQKRLKGELLAAYSCWKGIYKGDRVKLFWQWQTAEPEATATRCSLGGSDWTQEKEKSFPRIGDLLGQILRKVGVLHHDSVSSLRWSSVGGGPLWAGC